MLSSMGLDSPMFEYLEQVSKVGSPPRPKPAAVPTMAPQTPEMREAQIISDAEKQFRQFVGGNVGVVSREKNIQSLAGVTLSNTDIEVIKNYMQIIDDICINAEKLSELRSDIALEMYKYCQAVYSRCMNIISAKSAHGVNHQMDVLLSLSEDLDVRVKLFKNTYIDLPLKEKAPRPKKEEVKTEGKPRVEEDGREEIKEPARSVKPKLNIKPLPPPPSNPFFQFETKQEPLLDLLEGFEEKKVEERKVEEGKSGEAAADLLSWKNSGFSIHKEVAIKDWDREGLERLLGYCSRPALS